MEILAVQEAERIIQEAAGLKIQEPIPTPTFARRLRMFISKVNEGLPGVIIGGFTGLITGIFLDAFLFHHSPFQEAMVIGGSTLLGAVIGGKLATGVSENELSRRNRPA